jgi:hypothetical protein
MSKGTSSHSEIRANEAGFLSELTVEEARSFMKPSYEAYTLWDPFRDASDEERNAASQTIDIKEEQWTHRQIKDKIKNLKQGPRTLEERTARLPPNYALEATRLLGRLQSLEVDQHFEWTLTQIESAEDTPASPPRESTSVTMFFKRGPRQGVNLNDLLQRMVQIKASKLLPNSSVSCYPSKRDPAKLNKQNNGTFDDSSESSSSENDTESSSWRPGRSFATSISSRSVALPSYNHRESRSSKISQQAREQHTEISVTKSADLGPKVPTRKFGVETLYAGNNAMSHDQYRSSPKLSLEPPAAHDANSSSRFEHLTRPAKITEEPQLRPSSVSDYYINSSSIRPDVLHPIPMPILSIRPPSGAWTSQDDQTLLMARAQGINWAPIQQIYFPSKTPNACRKRHERLMERRSADDWDGLKLENLAKNYMTMRRDIWSPVAAQTGEKWNIVEQKVSWTSFVSRVPVKVDLTAPS